MNDSELKTFLAIVETGSLVRASRVLNVTQSTVTARLQALESELGQVLVNRNKSGATLTPAGVRLRRHASTITSLWSQARQEASLPDGMNSICNIACEPVLWSGFAEKFFHALRTNWPEVAVSIWLGQQNDVVEWLTQGKSDIVFTYRSASNARQDQIELPTEKLVLVSTNKNGPVRFDPGYIFVEAGEEFGREHAIEYADADTARLSFNDANLGRAHILRFGGSAYLPTRLVAEDIEAERLYMLDEAPIFVRRTFMLVNAQARGDWDWFEPSVEAAFGTCVR